MARDYKLRQRVRLRNSLKTIVAYGGLGVAAGAFVCGAVLFAGQSFNSESTMASRVQATISTPQSICAGESVQLEANGGDVYRWSPEESLSDPDAPAPTASPKSTTAYTARVYKKTGVPLRQSGIMPFGATLLNGRDKTLHRVATDVEPRKAYVVTLQARTNAYLDKATLQIRINNKVVGTCNVSSRFTKPLEIIWENKNDDEANLSLHLVNYDGDGEAVECNVFDFQELDETKLTTQVTVDKNCETCAVPTKPLTTNLDDKQVKLEWAKTGQPVIVRYKRTDEEYWKVLSANGHTTVLKNLSSLYDYEAQIANVCDDDTSKWSASVLLYSNDRLVTAGR